MDGVEFGKIESLADAEHAINVLRKRSLRDKTDIDLLTAQIDLIQTPWWSFRSRRHTKIWIDILSNERYEQEREEGWAAILEAKAEEE